MIQIPLHLKEQFYKTVRETEKKRCETAVVQHYYFLEDIDPYEIAPHLPETIELLSQNCLSTAQIMFERLELDSKEVENTFQSQLSVQRNDTLQQVDILDEYCSIFSLTFSSGAHIVYKDIPSDPYELWQLAAEHAHLNPAKCVCCGDHLYSEYIRRLPLAAGQTANEYYYNLGVLFAIIHLFGAGDLHADNLRAVGNVPVVIDCDMILHLGKPYWRIAACGCLPYDDGAQYKKEASSASLYQGFGCPFTHEKQTYNFEDYVSEIKRGYKDCATQLIPQIANEFLACVTGAKYRYIPVNEALIKKIFSQRIVMGYHEPKSDAPIIRKIMEHINQLHQPKFYAEVDGSMLYYGDEPLGEVNTITTELLEYRLRTIPTANDIAVQFEDIDNAARIMKDARNGFV